MEKPRIEPDRYPLNGTRLYLRVQGEGEPLLLLHGGYSNLTVWNEAAAELKKFHTVIRFDQRGYGKSDPVNTPYSAYEDIRAVLDHLQVERTTIMASSFGGSAAIDFALAYPERVNKLVLIAPSLNGEKYPFRLTWEGIADFLRVKRHGMDKAAECFMEKPFWSYLIPFEDESRQQLKRLYLDNVVFFYQGKPSLHRPLLPLAASRLGELACPVLIVEGERDLPFNRQVCAKLERGISGAARIRMDGCGHYPHLEAPDRLLSSVLPFLVPS
ncbi:alpha/beta fold hydrolase [Gorillibacterium timonense]|uniref:alpha/beta fold hydrolase n=1 Tax=Gorillibacterium timonense TaxID=1689269 RepID=UPI00071D112C|nr:alpha/beta hydrolase [Gorillibacterium timonense]